jgi:citrate synthase
MNDNQSHYIPGLEGVVAAQTRLSHVDGEAGELVIAGFPLEEIAPRAAFEEMVYLLWSGELPTASQLEEFRFLLAENSRLPAAVLDVLRAAASTGVDSMEALRMTAGLLSLDLPSDSQGWAQDAALLARLPVMAATWWRLRSGLQPLEPPPGMGLASSYLYMLRGSEPHPAHVRALETYLNTVIDHGLNASTFTARVIISTGSDLVSALVGAIGALKGPLHGGAPGPALQMVFEIGDPDQAEAYLRKKPDGLRAPRL